MRIGVDYLLAKEKLNRAIVGHVENETKLSRKGQLESYDGCARLRPVWDEIASKYDVVITPSVPDEAPVGIADTGNPVSYFPPLCATSFHLLMGNRPSARSGVFSKFHVSMFQALQERMACLLG